MNKSVSSRYAKETIHKCKNVFDGIMNVKYDIIECTYNYMMLIAKCKIDMK